MQLFEVDFLSAICPVKSALLGTRHTVRPCGDSLSPVLAKSAGATEALKASDPMRWDDLMNACKAQAEEIIFTELIYN